MGYVAENKSGSPACTLEFHFDRYLFGNAQVYEFDPGNKMPRVPAVKYGREPLYPIAKWI